MDTRRSNNKDTHLLLQAFFENAMDYQVLLNQDLEIILYNRAASVFTRKLLNFDLHEGDCITNYISSSFVTEFKEICERALAGEVISYEHFIRTTKDGAWYNFTISPVKDNTKKVMALTVVGTSTNREKSREKKINEQSRSLSFIAQLQSHQVRQPVSSILGIVNLIKEDNFQPKQEYILGLEAATHQLDNIIKAIVTQSRAS